MSTLPTLLMGYGTLYFFLLENGIFSQIMPKNSNSIIMLIVYVHVYVYIGARIEACSDQIAVDL